VRQLQEQLNRHGAKIAVDGDFGPSTERAVRAFQAANGISGDNGVVGQRTQDLLGGPNAKPIPAESVPVSTSRATGYRGGRAYSLELASIGNGQYLTPPAAAAFREMSAAAKQDGVHLDVVSSFRGNEEQRQLYQAYRSGRGNLAARPGYSNHQQGLAVDITTGGSRQSASYRWLAQNGARFGFANTVPSEPWHWEYIR
jgi:peptidoglycan hydrolase-like protein with peptidoglycan-binding domain